jgi:aspartokinase/homoserine dehydrogenase 1
MDDPSLPANPLFVDCTASAEVSSQYPELLASGVPVVTPNKLALSGRYSDYVRLQDSARSGRAPFRYETTVGAALPILGTVRNLRLGGDRVRTVTAVLSGTLSYVFGEMALGAPFSSAVAEARRKGFTEPHPREDLDGADVARKLLILLREAGLGLEPDAVPVESLVPEPVSREEDPERFLEGLGAADDLWRQRVGEAGRNRLTYLAWFDGSRSGVGVRVLSEDHPLASLRPGENMVVLTTDRYPDVPLTIAGPGAGREVTASGVFTDLLAAIRDSYGCPRAACLHRPVGPEKGPSPNWRAA